MPIDNPDRTPAGTSAAARGRLRARQAGVTAIEYALIAALIAVVILASVSLTGTNLKALYDSSTSKILAAIRGAVGP
ncbi:MAG: Flp family type IVb pilin [Burkholderiaceae bacterium]|nr:Flp family type IVb pilin [Burkholderiaceae bacterium]